MEELNFEEMRNQIAILKNKVNAQEIVNDRLLRESMKTKVSIINRVEVKTVLCAVVCILLFPIEHYYIGFSWSFVVATCLMMFVCIGCTMYFHYPLHKADFMSGDLATVARGMARFKRQYDNWLHYVTPSLLVPWMAWACYEYIELNSDRGINPVYIVAPLLIGGLIGGLIGYRWHRKAVNTAQNIIDQIEE